MMSLGNIRTNLLGKCHSNHNFFPKVSHTN